MFNLSITAKRLISAVIVIYFALLVGAFVFFFGDIDAFLRFALGLTLGSACACARAISMDATVRKSIEGDKVVAGAFLGRYVLTIGVLVVSAMLDIFNMWATIMGVLSLTVAAYIVPMIFKNS